MSSKSHRRALALAAIQPHRRSRPHRGQIGLARQVHVERLEPPRRLQQQPGRIAAKTRGESDMSPQQVDPGLLEPIKRPGLRCR